jgi:hypothetical protein
MKLKHLLIILMTADNGNYAVDHIPMSNLAARRARKRDIRAVFWGKPDHWDFGFPKTLLIRVANGA